MKNTARTLHGKALSSLRTAMTSFNSPHDDGRATTVLLHLQHAFEMLLKAALSQSGAKTFDKRTGRSIGFEAAVNQARQLASVKLTEDEAALLRAIDALRDDEQHWFNDVAEGLLFLYARGAVTLFDELLTRAFGEKLADHLPTRVLPVSTEAPQDFLTLVDSEYANISELLKPGRRARYEARAKIRTLLALEAHVSEDVRVSDPDVNRVEMGIKAGKTRAQVFPRLGSVGAEISGDGVTVKVKIVKRDDALPVRLVKAGEEVDAAAVREVDVQDKFHWTSSRLAGKLGLSTLKAAVLREHLGIDSDPSCTRTIPHNRSLLIYYSDNALTKMRAAMESPDLDAIWESHGKVKRAKPRPACTQPGCVVAKAQQAAS